MIWNGSLEPIFFFILQTQDTIAAVMGMKKMPLGAFILSQEHYQELIIFFRNPIKLLSPEELNNNIALKCKNLNISTFTTKFRQ